MTRKLRKSIEICTDDFSQNKNLYWPVGAKLKQWTTDMQAWRSLVVLFGKLEFHNIDDVWVGALAVYGWMPRTLRAVHNSVGLCEMAREIREIAGVYNSGRARFDPVIAAKCRSIITSTADHREVLIALETGSNKGSKSRTESSVGTSKFLHFLAPHIFPIWDRYTAAALGVANHLPASAWLTYVAEVHNALDSQVGIPGCVTRWLNEASGMVVPDVRAIEFVLWAYGSPRN